jgi:3-hydroxyisobutyrate dehydrogenase
MSPRIGFVGVGRMGSAMLQKVMEAGFKATLCDPLEKALAPFVAGFPEQVRIAATPRTAAEQSDLIGVCVNTNEQLVEACLGADGVLAGAAPGSIVLIHSTVSHATLHRLGEVAGERGIHVLDAMVSGARGHLSTGNLAVMVGGDAAAFERAKPLMETYGGLVLHLGPRGSGLDAKLSLNMFRYLVMVAGQEATALAESAGVGAVLPQLVAHAEANRYVGNMARLTAMHDIPLAQRAKDAELAQKDLRAAIARAAQVGVALPSAELGVKLMHRLWGAERSESEV